MAVDLRTTVESKVESQYGNCRISENWGETTRATAPAARFLGYCSRKLAGISRPPPGVPSGLEDCRRYRHAGKHVIVRARYPPVGRPPACMRVYVVFVPARWRHMPCRSIDRLRRWLQLRFDFNSTALRPFDSLRYGRRARRNSLIIITAVYEDMFLCLSVWLSAG